MSFVGSVTFELHTEKKDWRKGRKTRESTSHSGAGAPQKATLCKYERAQIHKIDSSKNEIALIHYIRIDSDCIGMVSPVLRRLGKNAFDLHIILYVLSPSLDLIKCRRRISRVIVCTFLGTRLKMQFLLLPLFITVGIVSTYVWIPLIEW